MKTIDRRRRLGRIRWPAASAGLKNEMPAPLIYRIDAPTIEAGASLPADLSVIVERAAPGLDGDGIAGRWPGRRIDYLAGARWADELPSLLQSALVEAFQDSGRLRSVQGDVGRFRTTHTLVIEVRRFEADYTAGGAAGRAGGAGRYARPELRTGACSRRSRLRAEPGARPRTARRRSWRRWTRPSRGLSARNGRGSAFAALAAGAADPEA